MRYGWMSFADLVDGADTHLGACVVAITEEDLADAHERLLQKYPDRADNPVAQFCGACLTVSHREGCNPGGQVFISEIPPDVWVQMDESGIKPGRLLTAEQRTALQLVKMNDDDQTS